MAHAKERGTLEGFGQEVSKHNISGAIVNAKLLVAHIVSDEEVMDINVLGIFGARTFPVVGQKYAALVVLVNHVVSDIETLGFKEQAGP